MLRFRKSEIMETANKITHNSELYGDEVTSVAFELSALSESANELGCCLEDEVSNYWGNAVKVCAIPDRFKHSWRF